MPGSTEMLSEPKKVSRGRRKRSPLLPFHFYIDLAADSQIAENTHREAKNKNNKQTKNRMYLDRYGIIIQNKL